MKKTYNTPTTETIELEGNNIIAGSYPEINDNEADNNKPVLSDKNREWGNLWN